jgi:hypothetical protein
VHGVALSALKEGRAEGCSAPRGVGQTPRPIS